MLDLTNSYRDQLITILRLILAITILWVLRSFSQAVKLAFSPIRPSYGIIGRSAAVALIAGGVLSTLELALLERISKHPGRKYARWGLLLLLVGLIILLLSEFSY